MTVENLVRDLGIKKIGTYSTDGSYVIDIDSDDEYGKVYSRLDRNDDLDYMDESSTVTYDAASTIWRYEDEYQLVLIADLKHDTYKLVISEL